MNFLVQVCRQIITGVWDYSVKFSLVVVTHLFFLAEKYIGAF